VRALSRRRPRRGRIFSGLNESTACRGARLELGAPSSRGIRPSPMTLAWIELPLDSLFRAHGGRRSGGLLVAAWRAMEVRRRNELGSAASSSPRPLPLRGRACRRNRRTAAEQDLRWRSSSLQLPPLLLPSFPTSPLALVPLSAPAFARGVVARAAWWAQHEAFF
jgi:hypothetical protein